MLISEHVWEIAIETIKRQTARIKDLATRLTNTETLADELKVRNKSLESRIEYQQSTMIDIEKATGPYVGAKIKELESRLAASQRDHVSASDLASRRYVRISELTNELKNLKLDANKRILELESGLTDFGDRLETIKAGIVEARDAHRHEKLLLEARILCLQRELDRAERTISYFKWH